MSTTRTGLVARATTALAVTAGLLVAPGITAVSAAAEAPDTSAERADLAATFIADTLSEGGDHYVYPGTDYFDGGNTIDAILALDGTGVGADAARAAFTFLELNVGGYTGLEFGSTYAGPTAKALLAVAVQGGDPLDVGGYDLVAELGATEGAVEPGRFSDLPVDCGYATCDYSNTVTQSLAIIALDRVGLGVSAEATSFLLAQQCADGGFSVELGAASCTSDTDATAFAAQALLSTGADTEAQRALDFLAARQEASGGLAGADAGANANTTGLAVQAFVAGGRAAAAAAGQVFIASLQYGCSAPLGLRWGIAYTDATRSTTAPSDSDLRATPQATLGLAGGSLLSVTSAGSVAELPSFTCATTSPSADPTTPTDSGSASSTTTAGAPASSSSTSSPADSGAASSSSTSPATAAAATSGSLAQTGSNMLLPALVGVVLVGLGALAVWSARRRGSHV